MVNSKLLIEVGSFVIMDECPHEYPISAIGRVVDIAPADNCVVVRMDYDNSYVYFDLDGDSWSECGEFKRDCSFVSLE